MVRNNSHTSDASSPSPKKARSKMTGERVHSVSNNLLTTPRRIQPRQYTGSAAEKEAKAALRNTLAVGEINRSNIDRDRHSNTDDANGPPRADSAPMTSTTSKSHVVETQEDGINGMHTDEYDELEDSDDGRESSNAIAGPSTRVSAGDPARYNTDPQNNAAAALRSQEECKMLRGLLATVRKQLQSCTSTQKDHAEAVRQQMEEFEAVVADRNNINKALENDNAQLRAKADRLLRTLQGLANIVQQGKALTLLDPRKIPAGVAQESVRMVLNGEGAPAFAVIVGPVNAGPPPRPVQPVAGPARGLAFIYGAPAQAQAVQMNPHVPMQQGAPQMQHAGYVYGPNQPGFVQNQGLPRQMAPMYVQGQPALAPGALPAGQRLGHPAGPNQPPQGIVPRQAF